jgi:hypothetical protein
VPFRYDAAADTWRGLDEFGTPVVAGESLEGCAAALAAYQRGDPIVDEDAGRAGDPGRLRASPESGRGRSGGPGVMGRCRWGV